MIPYPAFILGNSPALPADLSPLNGKFTVGINRILQTGFEPTVLFWVDHSVWEDEWERMDASDSLVVCDKGVAQRQSHVGIRITRGIEAVVPTPQVSTCEGNTGTCAARWAIGLGCPKVFLAGMDAHYRKGKTNFYGKNPHHAEKTLRILRRELAKLAVDHPDMIEFVITEDDLRAAVEGLKDIDQDSLRTRILEEVSSERPG